MPPEQNDPRRVPVTCRKVTTQLVTNVLSELAHAFLLHVGAEIPLGHVDGSERQRNEPFDKAVLAEGELEGASSNIHHDSTTDSQIKMRERASEAEAGFVLSVQNSYLETGLRLHELEKFFAIGGIAHRARGDDLRALHTELVGERRHSGQRAQRVLNRDLAQRPFLVKARAQSWSGLHFVYDADGSGGRDISYRLADRVRADVDRGDADVRIAPLRGSAGAAESQMRICGSGHVSKLTLRSAKGNSAPSGICVRPGPRLCRRCR